jgi:N-acyl-D-amino-acid deacylase
MDVVFDVLVRGGMVVDGTGRPGRPADVAIRGDRVAAVQPLPAAEAETVIDAAGRVVAPGFIDVHVHSEVALRAGPHRYGGVLQGVTTQLLAPDGFGWAALPPAAAAALWQATRFAYGDATLRLDWPTPESYLAEFAGCIPANVLPQVPHCAVRLAAMGWAPRRARADELAAMERGVRAWMEAGAAGLCLGLEYQPSAAADTEELIALARVAAAYGGVYAAHIRQRERGVAGAWRETMEIGRQAGVPVHISHTFVNDVTEPLLEEAAGQVDLTFESYLYPAGCTHLVLMLPQWAQAGGPQALQRRLRDPGLRPAIAAALEEALGEGAARGARGVFAATASGRHIGCSVQEAAAAAGLPLGEFAVRTLEEEDYTLLVWHHGGTEAEHTEVLRRTIRHGRMMVASDGIYHGARPHPRGYGCFSRVLRLAVRELNAVPLEEAVRKMSAIPAERFRVPDRGVLAPGAAADVVVFDPATVADRATWEEPYREPVGVDAVLVNGQVVVAGGRPTGRLPGRVLRRRGA